MSQDQSPPTSVGKTAAFARYVVYSPTRGVAHAGTDGAWFFSGDKPAHFYPTFPHVNALGALADVMAAHPDVTDLKLMQCLPKKGNDATLVDLNNSMIPPPRKPT